MSIDPIWPEHVVRNILSDLIPPNSNQTRNIVKSSTDSIDTWRQARNRGKLAIKTIVRREMERERVKESRREAG